MHTPPMQPDSGAAKPSAQMVERRTAKAYVAPIEAPVAGRLQSLLMRLGTLVLGSDRAMRLGLAGQLASAAVYAMCCAVAFLGADAGLTKPNFPQSLTVVFAVLALSFYAAVRSGWSVRFKDPSLLLPQMLSALLAITYAYTQIVPQQRGAVFLVITLVVVFGMYSLSPRQAIVVGVCAAGFLGGTTLVMSHIDPAFYPPHYEILRFELLAGTLPALTFTAHLIAAYRRSLSQQRRELRATLERLQQLATRDALTGLVNRRHMQEMLEQACAVDRESPQAQHSNSAIEPAFCVALIDLDHFKRINDMYGHHVGDEVLQGFGKTAQSALRTSDVIARWGGEEFLIFFPESSVAEARAALERLNELLVDQQLAVQVPELRVRFSAGLAAHSLRRPLDHTLERADRALYRAKSEGRNRSLVARDTVMSESEGVVV